MDTQTLRKFCSVCKLANDIDALVCQHCGAPFVSSLNDAPTTQRPGKSFELTEEIKDQVTSSHTPPRIGLSIFLLNNGEPIALSEEPEFVLGRGEGPSAEPLVDLTKYEGFVTGVSRRHAMIKAVDDKYVLIDLNSSNGTWLNGERLLPTKPHDLPSGGVIQLGRLKLVVVYLRPPTYKKTN
ncbi:MAG: FHA domain-containing protein [Chloroflexi bacterium]|nr:FHA domain-containing protein [Chloroflexota bacterium]